MVIDYIYLLLIILIICLIIFIIYLSYEKTECFVNNNNTIMDITGIKTNMNEFNNNINNFDINYQNFETEINNRDVTRDNIKNLDIYKKTNINLLNSENIKELSNKLKLTKQKEFPMDKLIKTIKSKYNAQYISTFSNDMLNYGILANDKCLTVNGLCKEDFCLLDCQNNLYSSNSQKFNTERINNSNDAAIIMNVPIDNISSKNVYPFNIFKSLVNDNCLTISNDGVTVEQCNLNNIQQQWEISPDENICVLK